jgi:hypothetical protein
MYGLVAKTLQEYEEMGVDELVGLLKATGCGEKREASEKRGGDFDFTQSEEADRIELAFDVHQAYTMAGPGNNPVQVFAT